MRLRHPMVGGLLIALAVLLAGCGGAGAPAPTAPPTQPAARDPGVTLVLWHGWSGGERQALSQLIDEYNRQNPGGRVLAQSVPLSSFKSELADQAGAGGGPHLALIPSGWLGDLAAADVLLPLDDQGLDQAALLPSALASAQVADAAGARSLYGLPLSFDTLVLFYNRANVLAPPEDTDVLIRQAHGLGSPQAEPPLWGLALNLSLDHTLGYLYAFGGRVFDARGELVLGGDGRAGTERWLEWLAQLNADARLLVRADSGVRVDREVKSNRVLMSFGWAHQLADYRRLWGDQLGVAPLPALSATGERPVPYLQSAVLALNRRAGPAERLAALAFMRFMASQPAQRFLMTRGMQPARQDVPLAGEDQQAVMARAFRSQAESSQPFPNGAARDVVRQELQLMQQRVLTGSASAADAVTQAEARLRAALAGQAR